MKIKVHPLFFLSLLLYAFCGRAGGYLLAFFLISVHELSHCLVALTAGAKNLSVVIMPYGAALFSDGEIPHLPIVLLAGPFSNLVLASFSLSACWIIPELYGYFKGFIISNVFLALLNLLPAYPLDGGRLVRWLFPSPIVKAATSVFTLTMGILTLFAAVVYQDLSFLFFALFLLFAFVLPIVGGRNRRAMDDPLYTLARTDEEGRIKRATIIEKGKKPIRLSAEEVTKLLLLYPPHVPIREAIQDRI